MVNFSTILVFMILIVVCNSWMWRVNGCSGRDVRCGRHGPPIRFPFQLKDRKTETGCGGYTGFELTCSNTHKTLLELPSHPHPIILEVTKIEYQYQQLQVSDPENCISRQILKLLQSPPISPFQLDESNDDTSNFTFLDCSSLSCPVYVFYSTATLLDSGLDPILCTKTLDIISSSVSMQMFSHNFLVLTWLKPNCSKCEIEGKMCKLKTNGTEDEIECFDRHHKPTKKILLYATVVFVGLVLVTLCLAACLHLYSYFKHKGEDAARIEKFLEDYRKLNPARFSYADIKRITNNFREELGEGAHGAVFKGKLSNDIFVAVKMLNNIEGDGKEFINEVKAMGKVHHINVVRLVGFCVDGCYRALVYNFFSNGSLQNFITSPDDMDRFLGWEKLQQISIGIAKGIEYLHMSCDQRILHFDINPHNVLLDDKLVPKITDFGLAKLCAKNQSIVSVTAARGTLGYITPEVFSRNFGNVSYKADIYSYGMLLLEMIGGRKNIGKLSEENFQVLYPEWIHNLLQGREMQLNIEGERDDKILKKLAIVGLWWHSVAPNKPSIYKSSAPNVRGSRRRKLDCATRSF